MGPLVAKQAIAFRMENDHRMGHFPWVQHGSKQIFLNLVGNAVKSPPTAERAWTLPWPSGSSKCTVSNSRAIAPDRSHGGGYP